MSGSSTTAQITPTQPPSQPAPAALPVGVDSDQLEKIGFPPRVVKGFLDAASELDSAIASRCPGGPATQLIDDGHALKSFYVHAKSCDWGPMAGFVCQLPPLNKKGPGNAGFNLEEQVNSIGKFKRLVDAAAAAAKASPVDRPAAAAQAGLAEWPFVPLAISRAALDRLFAQGFLEADLTSGYVKGGGAGMVEVLGCCANENKDVLVEFVMRPQPSPLAGRDPWWALYHRQVWVATTPGVFKPYLELRPAAERLTLDQDDPKQLLSQLVVATAGEIMLSAAQTSALDKACAAWAARQKVQLAASALAADAAYPIAGTQNPWLTYPQGDPRNAVSGDYDLFAVWPRTPEGRWEETVRFSESRSGQPVSVPLRQPAPFRGVRRRPFTVELANSPNIRLEVIPGFNEIKDWEDAVLGNINDAVGLAVGMLNACITHEYDRQHCGRATPNLAFHSDEGGRPGVNEIEYPVAVFLPKTLRVRPDQGAIVLRTHDDFLTLLERLSQRCELPLNFGWMVHLLADLATPQQLQDALDAPGRDAKTQAAVAKYIAERLKKQAAMSAALTGLRRRTAALLDGYDNPPDRGKREETFGNACKTFIAVACLQLDPKAKAAAMVSRILDGEPTE